MRNHLRLFIFSFLDFFHFRWFVRRSMPLALAALAFGVLAFQFAVAHPQRALERAAQIQGAGLPAAESITMRLHLPKFWSVVYAREAYADTSTAVAVVPATPAAAPAATPSDGDQLKAILDAVQKFGGAPWVMKIALICLILTALMKVSFLQPLWAKLGAFQAMVAPLLAAIGGIISMSPITLPGVLAYLSAGAGAIVLHELLDASKGIPGIGAGYVSAINFVEGILGAPKA